MKTGYIGLDILIYLVLFSFVEYWDHRILHTKPFWRLHRMHHTATEMNFITSGRNHPAVFAFEPLLRVWIPALLGTPVEFLLIWPVIHHFHQLLSHSMLNWDWGKFGKWVIISPDAHRVHHSKADKHYQKNFSNFLTLWDHVFGTWYTPNKEQIELGLDEDPATVQKSLAKELTYDLKEFFKDMRSVVFGRINRAK